MSHPFELDPDELEANELDFEEQLTEEEAARVGGGLTLATTHALGEEGGCHWFPKPIPLPFPKPIPGGPTDATTLATCEEGGADCNDPISL